MKLAYQVLHIFGLFIGISGCTSMCNSSHEDMSPEQVVEGYLEVAFNMKDVKQKEMLLHYTTDNLKAAINQASEETIRKAYIDRNLKIKTFSVVEKRFRSPRETEITFQLTYRDLAASADQNPDSAPEITTENTVSVVKESGVWLIADVLGNKTAIDFPVTKESEISAKAPDNK